MKKKIYIQILGVIACLAVVAMHVNGCFWQFSYDRYWITANIIECICYFAVPIFFMISGATLLNYRKRYTTAVLDDSGHQESDSILIRYTGSEMICISQQNSESISEQM